MTDYEPWFSSPEVEGNPLLGDAEFVTLHFEPGVLSARLLNANVERESTITFSAVRYFRFCSDGPLIIDRIDILDSLDGLSTEADTLSLTAPRSLGSSLGAGDRVFHLVPIAGGDSFVVAREARLSPWTALT
jgi:hypothetical protein